VKGGSLLEHYLVLPFDQRRRDEGEGEGEEGPRKEIERFERLAEGEMELGNGECDSLTVGGVP